MQRYVVETYLARGSVEDLRSIAARLRSAARCVSRKGAGVTFVRSTALPADETCFHVFVAESQESVAEICRQAGLGSARIVPAVEYATGARGAR
jgi:hypothetical protein